MKPQMLNFCPECGKFLKIIEFDTDYYYSCTVCGYKEMVNLDLEVLREETHLEFEYQDLDPTEFAKFIKWKEDNKK
ncbi:MAG: hypothetical protein HWN81_08395 [Candidatus Lokiarchaeota archaeon]|nr:hypothetical protein [Candidatus Lokiarchaeota archaeon]